MSAIFEYLFGGVKQNVHDTVIRQAALQREVQMAVAQAKARDQIFGTAWATLTGCFIGAKIGGHKPPAALAAPILIGSLVLGNMADMAYGNKLVRVTKEAEHILDHERAKMVPPKQVFFYDYYTEEEREAFPTVKRVGEYWPWN